jgi:hypothetical protein
MKRTIIAIAVAAFAFGSACIPSQAAPIAPVKSAATSKASNIILAYYYRGRYYPYRYHGHYYPYRYGGRYYRYRYGGNYYLYRYGGRYCNHRYYRNGHYYCR